MAELSYAPQVDAEELPGRAFPHLPEELPSGVPALGRGIENAGEMLQQHYDATQALVRQTQLADAHNRLQALSLKLTHDPQTGALTKEGQNAFGLDGQYLPQYDQGAQAILSTIQDPRVAAAAQAASSQVRTHLAEQLDAHELTQHKTYAADTSKASLAMAGATAAANFNHPDIVASNKDTVNLQIDQLAHQQGWSPETTAYNRAQALSDFHGAIIDSMAGQGKISQARTYLYQQAAAGEISPKAADSMQRMLYAQEEHQLAMADKQQRDASNAILKNGIQLSMQGKLSPAWIERYHNTLEPQAYEYLYGSLDGKGIETDPHVYAPLLTGALSGKDVSEEATRALYSHQISLADYKGLIEKSDQPRKGYVARGADYISQSLRTNPMVPDPAGQRSLANALDDWRQAVEDHPDWTEEQARSAYRSITDHYQIISADKTTLFNAVPLYLVGTRTEPKLQETWAATKAAHEAGQISDAEYQRQATLLQQWVAATRAQQQKKKSQ